MLLLAHIETLAAARRWVRLDLDVLTDNEATRLYRRAGYDETAYVIYRRMLTPGDRAMPGACPVGEAE